MKTIAILGTLIPFCIHTMDQQHPEITFYSNGSLIIESTRYKSSKDLIEKNPTLAEYTIETLKESNHHLSSRIEKLQKKHTEALDTIKLSNQLKTQQSQAQEKTMQTLQDMLIQMEKTKKEFEEVKARTIYWNQWTNTLYYSLNFCAYAAVGYSILAFHNQACSTPSHTYIHELVCNPF